MSQPRYPGGGFTRPATTTTYTTAVEQGTVCAGAGDGVDVKRWVLGETLGEKNFANPIPPHTCSCPTLQHMDHAPLLSLLALLASAAPRYHVKSRPAFQLFWQSLTSLHSGRLLAAVADAHHAGRRVPSLAAQFGSSALAARAAAHRPRLTTCPRCCIVLTVHSALNHPSGRPVILLILRPGQARKAMAFAAHDGHACQLRCAAHACSMRTMQRLSLAS